MDKINITAIAITTAFMNLMKKQKVPHFNRIFSVASLLSAAIENS
ncbi:hypothetical protein J559_3046 [Acinetobacter sp. 983759]|nr:hypothetical protein J559_3046 [Acinetobacter sp. 983759]EXE55970.1 hypothetical protein J579_2899 [Acinetobacter sp. 1239920]